MRLSLSTRAKILMGAAALGLVGLVAVGDAEASNMGFKHNKVICLDGPGADNGKNLVAMPYRNPYMNAQDVCDALGLTAAVGRVQQVRAQNGQLLSHLCGDVGAFAFQEPPGVAGQGLKRNGITAFNNVQVNGILVGSHAGNPPGGITLFGEGAGLIGENHFPPPYHTTAANAQDICVDLGIPNATRVRRVNACTGATQSHLCGDVGAFALVLGEAILIDTLPVGPAITAPPGHPAHF